ncbi:uncharacterized protein LOC127012049 [Drosophila biarmipes]|uniref:uncharacterized protein LOC127012049 n=1 Tax=Drosophila biarmipes TaxID=125945 RepID=UPI0021CCEC8D|nr:uncharacterized protein LOC127012049 [Drosophila biarmipes]
MSQVRKKQYRRSGWSKIALPARGSQRDNLRRSFCFASVCYVQLATEVFVAQRQFNLKSFGSLWRRQPPHSTQISDQQVTFLSLETKSSHTVQIWKYSGWGSSSRRRTHLVNPKKRWSSPFRPIGQCSPSSEQVRRVKSTVLTVPWTLMCTSGYVFRRRS